MSRIHLIGIDDRGLAEPARQAIAACDALFCSARFRPLLGGFAGDVLPISPLPEALKRMAERVANADIAVLASGDPLFFGIGRTLIECFGPETIEISPALSSMQLAFARCREPWDDAVFLSLHGRGGFEILPTLLNRRKVFLFTDSRHSPQAIAAAIGHGLDGLGIDDSDCRIMVAENLGLADERISHGSPAQIAAQEFGDLNVMIVRLGSTGGRWSCTGAPFDSAQETVLGLTEREIAHSRGLISKDEVRAAILHGLRLPPNGVLWDIGAGSGSVSVEAARICPGLTVFAIERHPDQQANVLANRGRYWLANLHLIRGQAPQALAELPDPDRVFIGGSGGELATIVKAASVRLRPQGRIMVSAVTEATRQAAPALLHQHGLQVQSSTIAVTRESYPPQAAGALALNPITLILGQQ